MRFIVLICFTIDTLLLVVSLLFPTINSKYVIPILLFHRFAARKPQQERQTYIANA